MNNRGIILIVILFFIGLNTNAQIINLDSSHYEEKYKTQIKILMNSTIIIKGDFLL